MSQRDEELSQQRKDNQAERVRVREDSIRTSEQAKPEGEANLRRGGISGGKVDAAVTAQARQDELNKNPRPLVHVDPSTGIPISKPFGTGAAGSEPNQLTQPGRPENATVAGNDPARNAQAQAILHPKGKP